PVDQSLPQQERGVRPARALPYTLHARGAFNRDDGSFAIVLQNSGEASAVFQVRSGYEIDAPRTYTLEPQTEITDRWDAVPTNALRYELAVYGPNGFLRSFKTGVGAVILDAIAAYDERRSGIRLSFTNRSEFIVTINVLDAYSGMNIATAIAPGRTISRY